MTDDFLTRAYADNHRHLSDEIGDAIAHVVDTISVSLDRLHHYEFDAPWQRDRAAH